MQLTILTTLRFVTPGVLAVLALILTGRLTGEWNIPFPQNLEDLARTSPVLVVSFLYYILPFRSFSNKRYFNDVSDNIRHRLVEISNVEDAPQLTWEKLRSIFYSIVDNDESLKVKSKLAYRNGYVWTTIADVRAISFVFIIYSIVIWYLGSADWWIAALVFSAIFVLSFVASQQITKKHKGIGEEQIEIIQLRHLDDLNEQLGKVLERGN